MTTADERHRETGPDTPSPSIDGRAERPGAEQIQAEIEQTRQELGQTVEALSAKLDVKARAAERIGTAKESAAHRLAATRVKAAEVVTGVRGTASQNQDRLLVIVPVGVAVAGLTVAGVLVWRHRHR